MAVPGSDVPPTEGTKRSAEEIPAGESPAKAVKTEEVKSEIKAEELKEEIKEEIKKEESETKKEEPRSEKKEKKEHKEHKQDKEKKEKKEKHSTGENSRGAFPIRGFPIPTPQPFLILEAPFPSGVFPFPPLNPS
jgi:archaellum component FlaD/FlaE